MLNSISYINFFRYVRSKTVDTTILFFYIFHIPPALPAVEVHTGPGDPLQPKGS